jgi:pimeloyl-ACP methyl ester carboxylesterase
MFAPLLPVLANAVRPVAIDTPGYGASDKPPSEWEVGDYAEAALAVAGRLDDRPFHLFGRATGALVAAEVALRRPDRLLSLTLFGLPVYEAAERERLLDGYAPPYVLAEDGAHLAWIWQRIRHEYPWMDAALATRCVADYLAAGPDFAAAYRAMWRYDAGRLARGWDVPTLLVHGGRDRLAEMRPRARALLPQAAEAFFPDATNFLAEQDPAALAAALLPFLARAAAR